MNGKYEIDEEVCRLAIEFINKLKTCRKSYDTWFMEAVSAIALYGEISYVNAEGRVLSEVFRQFPATATVGTLHRLLTLATKAKEHGTSFSVPKDRTGSVGIVFAEIARGAKR